MIYGQKEEKILSTYIYNTCMVLVVAVLTLYGEKLPQIAPKAAKVARNFPTSRRGT